MKRDENSENYSSTWSLQFLKAMETIRYVSSGFFFLVLTFFSRKRGIRLPQFPAVF